MTTSGYSGCFLERNVSNFLSLKCSRSLTIFLAPFEGFVVYVNGSKEDEEAAKKWRDSFAVHDLGKEWLRMRIRHHFPKPPDHNIGKAQSDTITQETIDRWRKEMGEAYLTMFGDKEYYDQWDGYTRCKGVRRA